MDTTTPLDLLNKMRNVQRAVNLKKDKTAQITSSFSYSYTSLAALWESVEGLLYDNNLYLSWRDEVSGMHDICVVYIVDLDSGQMIESKHIIPAFRTNTEKNTFDTRGNQTGEKFKSTGVINISEFDFRSEGAYHSYWRRMMAISLLGLVTTDDVAAEESYWTGKSEDKQPASASDPATTTTTKKRYTF